MASAPAPAPAPASASASASPREGSTRTVSSFIQPVVLSGGRGSPPPRPSRTDPLSAACSASWASSSAVTKFGEIDNRFTASDGVRAVELPSKTTSETRELGRILHLRHSARGSSGNPRFTGSAPVKVARNCVSERSSDCGVVSGISTVGMPEAAACSASRGPVVRAGESPANEITRTAGRGRLPFEREWSTCRRAHSVVARGRLSRRSRHAEEVVQLGASSEAMTGAPAARAISFRKRKRCPALEANEHEHGTTQQTERESNDACFDGDHVLGRLVGQ